MVALLTINLFGSFCHAHLNEYGLASAQFDGNPSMTADLAFNTATSFVSIPTCNTTQAKQEFLPGAVDINVVQFISAGTGMVACAVVLLR